MELLEKYGLHDTKISCLKIIDNGLALIFNNGIYQLENKKEYVLTNPCKLVLKIMYFSPLRLYEHIEVIVYKKSKFYEMRFLEFVDILNRNSFDIDDVMYSPFSRSILVKGFVDKYKINFVISEIEDIEVQFFEK